MARPPRGRADYFKPGDWNAACSMCGRKRKAGDLVQNWQGQWRCPEHNEQRHPQDFVRPSIDNLPPSFIQVQTYQFAHYCTPNGLSAVPGQAEPACVTPGYLHPAYLQADVPE